MHWYYSHHYAHMQHLDAEEIRKRCVSIRLVVSDVDGTLTDGGMYYSPEGEVMKRFSAHDGMGLRLLLQSGIQVALMTSETTSFAQARARKLGIQHVLSGVHNKADALQRLLVETDISLEETAFIGDDINDISAMEICAFVACPQDAVTSVRKIAHYICNAKGGRGAVRELVELILVSQNKIII